MGLLLFLGPLRTRRCMFVQFHVLNMMKVDAGMVHISLNLWFKYFLSLKY